MYKKRLFRAFRLLERETKAGPGMRVCVGAPSPFGGMLIQPSVMAGTIAPPFFMTSERLLHWSLRTSGPACFPYAFLFFHNNAQNVQECTTICDSLEIQRVSSSVRELGTFTKWPASYSSVVFTVFSYFLRAAVQNFKQKDWWALCLMHSHYRWWQDMCRIVWSGLMV